jgi:hypothetical protein
MSVPKLRALQWSVFLLAVAVAIYALASRCLGDPDLGWHLATGRSIVAHGAIPRTDDLAIAHGPVRYVVAVSDVLLHLAMRGAGSLGVQLLGAVVAVVTPFVVFLHARRTPAALIASALVLSALNAWVSPSAAPFSYPLLAIELLLIERHRRGARRAAIALVVLLFVWANTHGSVAIGVAVMLAYAASRVVERDRPWPTALVTIAGVLAATLNPGGARVLLGPARFGESLGNVTEWQAPTVDLLVHHEPLVLVVGAAGIAALIFGREPDDARRGRSPRIFDVLAVLGSLAAVTQMTRMIPLSVIVIAPIAARRLGHFVPATPAMALSSAAATLAAAAVLVLTPTTSRGVGFDPVIFPVDASSFVEAKQPAGRMWNFWPFGGYLSWRFGGAREVLVDGRNTLAHDRALVERANASVVDNAAFEKLVDDFDLQWAISRSSTAEPASGAGVARSKRFAMIYLDDVAAVYARKDGPNAALARDGYRILRHDMPPAIMLEIASGPNAAARKALAHDGDLAIAQAPSSTRSSFAFACGALAANDAGKLTAAIEALQRLGADPMLVAALESAQGRGVDLRR